MTKKYKKDRPEDIENLDLVQMARDLLEAMVESTAILEGKKMNEQGLKEAKLVLGYLNAANNNVKTRMQWFKMTGLESKINRVRASTNKIK